MDESELDWKLKALASVLIGAVALLVIRRLTSGSQDTHKHQPSKQEKHSCESNVGRYQKNDKDGFIESASDFLRNAKSIRVFINTEPSAIGLFDLCPEIQQLAQDSEAMSEKKMSRVVSCLHDALTKAWQRANSGDNLTLPEQVAATVIELLTVTPSMDCLLDASLMPPAMFQPVYTLAVAKNSIRCIADGFVGMPVFGPADPNKKYTQKRMRLVSQDVLEAATQGACKITNAYFMQATSATTTEDVVKQHESLLKGLCHGSESQSGWDEYLFA